MANLDSKSFEPDDIHALTDGRVTLAALRQWVKAGWFVTKLEEPRAGKPRQFPLMAVYEALFLSVFAHMGVPYAEVKDWNRQLLASIIEGTPPNYLAWTPGREKFNHITFDRDLSVTDLSIAFAEQLGDAWGEQTETKYQAPAAMAVLNIWAVLESVYHELEKRGAVGDAT